MTLPAGAVRTAARRRFCRDKRGGVGGFQILVVPGKIALVAIADKAGPREAVKLAGINDELCGNAERSERLVHLFTADDGHVKIPVTAHEQGGRVDSIGFEERVRDFHPALRDCAKADRVRDRIGACTDLRRTWRVDLRCPRR